MSLESRARSAGFASGFFGQLNRNISEEKKQKRKLEESLVGMRRNMELHRSKSKYDEQVKRQSKRREVQRQMSMTQGIDKSTGFFSDAGIYSMAATNTPGWEKMSDKQRIATVNTLSGQMKGVDANKFIDDNWGKLVGTQEVQNTISLPKEYDRNTVRQASTELILQDATTDVPVAPAPAVPPVTGVEGIVRGPSVTGDVLAAPEVTPVVTTTAAQRLGLEVEEEDPELVATNFVHLRNKEGDILTGETFPFAIRDDVPSIHKGGEWIPAPANIVLARKEEGRGKEAVVTDVEFTDKEITQLQYIQTAGGTLDRLGEISQLMDRGIVRGVQAMYNSFDEMLIANGIKGDNEITLLQIMARHDEDALAYGLSESSQLTSAEKMDLLDFAKNRETAPQDAAYMKGAINALKKLIPLQVVRAMSDNPRPARSLTDAIAGIIEGRPIGAELAGSVSELRRGLSGREESIYETRYAPDATPEKLRNSGWLYAGEVVRDARTGKFQYRINHESGKGVGVPVRMNPRVAELDKWLRQQK